MQSTPDISDDEDLHAKALRRIGVELWGYEYLTWLELFNLALFSDISL